MREAAPMRGDTTTMNATMIRGKSETQVHLRGGEHMKATVISSAKQKKGGSGMRLIAAITVVLTAVVFAGSAVAVPSGKSLEYAGGGAGKVVFDGKTHADKGLKCNDCHTKIFKMKKGSAEMKMKDINEGKFCGECHNGTKAFKASDPASCVKCHKK